MREPKVTKQISVSRIANVKFNPLAQSDGLPQQSHDMLQWRMHELFS